MDSQDFLRQTDPFPTRDESDARLQRALAWVGESAIPERVFAVEKLDAWATGNGYSKVDQADLIALLRQVEPLVDHPSQIATDINDAIVKYETRRV